MRKIGFIGSIVPLLFPLLPLSKGKARWKGVKEKRAKQAGTMRRSRREALERSHRERVYANSPRILTSGGFTILPEYRK